MSEAVKTTLVGKLAEIMAAIERVPKRGRNEFHQYDYATEADIVATVRTMMAERRIMLIPSVESVDRVQITDKGQALTTALMTFTFYDGDSHESISRKWAGAGTDKEDKGLYKAMTGAEKYFLMKAFMMPTGDDPEAEAEKPAARQKPQQRRQQMPEEATVKSAKGDDKVTAEMVARLKVMISQHGRTQDKVLGYLKTKYGVEGFKDLLRKDYDAVCTAVQAAPKVEAPKPDPAPPMTADDIPFAGAR